MNARRVRELRADDTGTIIPLIVLFFLVAAFVVMAGSATSSAFLAQRDLQGACDAAAVKAANAVDGGGTLYDIDALSQLPLSQRSVQSAVDSFRTQDYADDTQGLSMRASTDGRVATVTCGRTVRIPFGAFFGHADGLGRTAVSTARAPVRG